MASWFDQHQIKDRQVVFPAAPFPLSPPAGCVFIQPGVRFSFWHPTVFNHTTVSTWPRHLSLSKVRIPSAPAVHFHQTDTPSCCRGHRPWRQLLAFRYPTLRRSTDSLSRRLLISSEKGSRLARWSSSMFRRSRWRLDGLVFRGLGFTL